MSERKAHLHVICAVVLRKKNSFLNSYDLFQKQEYWHQGFIHKNLTLSFNEIHSTLLKLNGNPIFSMWNLFLVIRNKLVYYLSGRKTKSSNILKVFYKTISEAILCLKKNKRKSKYPILLRNLKPKTLQKGSYILTMFSYIYVSYLKFKP